MWFVFMATDKEGTLELRKQTRSQHLERLQQLRREGRLLVAGPCPAIASNDPGEAGFTGSVIIAEFASLAAAEQWAQDDPYTHAGVYDQVIVKPFIKALP